MQKLRDIHLPDVPGWWPPAPGWWLLALLLLAAAAWLAWRIAATARQRRPMVQARRLYTRLYGSFQRGEIDAREYLQQSNELVKRVLIHGLGESQARRATGDAWLALLDRHLGEATFSDGPGRLLGNARFHPALDGDAALVHPLLERLLGHLTPRWSLSVSPRSGAARQGALR